MAFPDGTADFRSDTVTRPTTEMRRAMADAPVGDDVYDEDPSVRALEDETAAILGVQAACYMPSGTMTNQVALNVWTRPGDTVLCVRHAHVRIYEHNAAAALSGLSLELVETDDGVITAADVNAHAAGTAAHPSPVTLVEFENTHNRSGGTVVPAETMDGASAAARALGLKVHLDGARLFNAAVAAGVPASRYAAAADSVSVCFSKALGAPIGSALGGPAEFVAEARRRRRRFGGGWRQAGIVAAAARVALADRERLSEDHVLAGLLWEEMGARYPEAVDAERPPTNMVRIHGRGLPVPAAALAAMLADEGVLVGFIAPGVLRFVTHRDVDAADVDRLLAVVDGIET